MENQKPVVYSVPQRLLTATHRQFIPTLETESVAIACQKIDGLHSFHHLNEQHDEILYVIKGELTIWTGDGEYHLKSGDLFKIPKCIEHGNIVGEKSEILIIEGRV